MSAAPTVPTSAGGHGRPAGPGSPGRSAQRRLPGRGRPGRRRPNVVMGIIALVWLALVGIPLYLLFATSLRGSGNYIAEGPLSVPDDLTLDNYRNVFEQGFHHYLLNSLTVAVSAILIVLAVALPAAFAIVRSRNPIVRAGFGIFLLGLAIPAQAVIIPVYLIIVRLGLYDSLAGIILPTAAFTLPISILVLTSSLRDVPSDLYESMTIDGARTWELFLYLVLPLARPGIVTVTIFVGLQAWNNFIFPLVLTQSPEVRVLPTALWTFQDQYKTDVPGLMAAVVLSLLPIFALYLFGRRQLLGGLAAGGFGK